MSSSMLNLMEIRSRYIFKALQIPTDMCHVETKDRIVPAFLKELIYKVLGLQVLFLELNRFGILLGEWEEGQSAFLTQGTVSSIPIVFSWSDSIRPEGFMSSVLLGLVIIVAVVGVDVTVVVVVESSSVVKLSFVIT
ncbi:hypothetical protein Tco_0185227 [Tanacetum coccineum]